MARAKGKCRVQSSGMQGIGASRGAEAGRGSRGDCQAGAAVLCVPGAKLLPGPRFDSRHWHNHSIVTTQAGQSSCVITIRQDCPMRLCPL